MTEKIMKLEPHPITDKNFLRSVRDLGLSTVDSVCELIDNSIDAGASIIRTEVFEDDDGISILVADNGSGIQPYELPVALSFGGQTSRKKDLSEIGKFGWGLSQAIVCQAKRGEVYSKIKGGDWYCSYLDLDELRKLEEPKIPAATKIELPEVYPVKPSEYPSGTVVILKKCDRLQRKGHKPIANLLKPEIGEIYRHYLKGVLKIYVNGEEVKVVDPLMLIPGCLNSEDFGPGQKYGSFEPIIYEDRIDPRTGKPAEIHITLSVLDIEKIVTAEKEGKEWSPKLEPSVDNQGLYLIRHNRQVKRAKGMSIIKKHPSMNYIRVEVLFPPVLDDLFGVQTTKNRTRLDESLRHKLADRLRRTIRDLVKNTKSRRDAAKAKLEEVEKIAEQVAAEEDDVVRRGAAKEITPEIKKKLEQELKREQDEVKKNKDLSENEKERLIKRIKNRYESKLPYLIVEENDNPTGDFYRLVPKGINTDIILNTAHPFYTEVYKAMKESSKSIYLDILLIALARTEENCLGSGHKQEAIAWIRRELSTVLATYLQNPHVSESSTTFNEGVDETV